MDGKRYFSWLGLGLWFGMGGLGLGLWLGMGGLVLGVGWLNNYESATLTPQVFPVPRLWWCDWF